MSGTRSLSRTAPATDGPSGGARAALLVAHGAPSAPCGPERAIRALAARVAEGLPGWAVRGATLAAPGALEAALAALPGRVPLVFPFFMSDGWFVRCHLPQRLAACGCDVRNLLPPLGVDPALHRLCLSYAREAVTQAGFAAQETAVLLAAHGSSSTPQPRWAAEAAARYLAAARTFRAVRLGFVDETPRVAEAARQDQPAVCLPFFAAHAGHVDIDLPRALAEAGFSGPLLEPIGCHPRVADLVREALTAAFADRVGAPGVHFAAARSGRQALP